MMTSSSMFSFMYLFIYFLPANPCKASYFVYCNTKACLCSDLNNFPTKGKYKLKDSEVFKDFQLLTSLATVFMDFHFDQSCI